jgi:hypothetical protein
MRQIDYAGEYVTARRIAGSLRVVLSTRVPSLEISAYLDPWQFCEMAAGKAVYDAAMETLLEENTRLIQSATKDQIVPKKLDSLDGVAEDMIQCQEVYGPETPAGTGLLSVVTLDLDAPKKKQTDIATFGEKGVVYASQDSLYLTSAGDYVDWAWRAGMWETPTSGIHKFDISTDPTKALYKATGEVEGRMLNQFCLGELDGYLRVATTTGTWDWTSWENHVTVFAEQGGKLAKVGHVGGFGAEEEIYGARFIGNRGFVVTFRQTDPLFTFDLADPTNPTLVGMWEGPGYSNYLHPFGADYLLAVGMEDWRVAVSLYNLTDFANPTMVERLYMSDGESELYSAAVYDHKAFKFLETDTEQGLMLLPYDGYTYNDTDGYMYDSGIALYDVTHQGFEDAGEMSLYPEEVADQAQQESAASRSAIIDGVLFAISDCRITSASLDNPGEPLATLAVFADNYCGREGDDYYYDEDDEWETDGVGVVDTPPSPGVDDGAEPMPDSAGESTPGDEGMAVDAGVAEVEEDTAPDA